MTAAPDAARAAAGPASVSGSASAIGSAAASASAPGSAARHALTASPRRRRGSGDPLSGRPNWLGGAGAAVWLVIVGVPLYFLLANSLTRRSRSTCSAAATCCAA